MSDRKKHIAVLKEMLEWMNMSNEVIKKDDPFFIAHEHRKKAVKYAIDSLETDEAYNLMYEQPEFCKDCISRSHLLSEIAKLKKSPWFNRGKNSQEYGQSIGYSERKEAVGMVENLCIKKKSSVLPKADVSETNVGKIESTTKNDLAHNLCDSCTNIGCEFQSGIVRTKCAFYMPPHIESDNCGNYVVQVSTTKNDLGVDCISRFEVTEILNSEYDIDKMLDRVDALPSVTPQEPKTGHWIMPNKDKTDRPMAECNLCGWYVNPNWIKEYNFCPNCGADMRGEEK